MQPTDAMWFSEAATAKRKLEHFIQQTDSQNLPKEDIEPLASKLQAHGRIHTSDYWVKEDPRINHWATYPGMPILLQRTQTVQDLLEETKAQAPQASQELLSPASSLAKIAQEAASLPLQIQTSAAAMANAPVGPIEVSLAIKLLQLADAAILESGGPPSSDAILVHKMIHRTARILHNINQAWP